MMITVDMSVTHKAGSECDHALELLTVVEVATGVHKEKPARVAQL